MEPVQQNQPVSAPSPIQQSSAIGKSKKIIASILLVLLIALAAAGYFFLNNRQSSSPENQKELTAVTPTQDPDVPPLEQMSSLPSDWMLEKNEACNISLPIPPQKAPYVVSASSSAASAIDAGGYWKFAQHTRGEQMFPNVAQVFYFKEDLPPGDYVAGNIQVTCADNTENHDTNTLFASFKNNFTNGTYAGISLREKGEKTVWDRTVKVFTIEGGIFSEGYEEYIFATPGHIYRVNKLALSGSDDIKATTQTIFDNILFHDE